MTNDEKIHGASLAADQPPASPSRSDAATARHTAAPWAIEFDVPCMFDIAVVAPNFGQGCLPFVAFVECKDHPDDDDAPAREEAIANAHLIAAAPEMFETLRFIFNNSGDPVIEAAALAAINKAVGRDGAEAEGRG